MRIRWSVLGLALIPLLAVSSYAKHATLTLPLPQQIMAAKTVYIDNQSGYAIIGDQAYEAIKKWDRYEVVNSRDKADLVLLFSSKQFSGGSTTTGTVNNYGVVTATTTSDSWGATYVTVLDPKSGTTLWSDGHSWGNRWSKSATIILIKELQDRVKKQEEGKN
jgi:hypothetical protein